MPAGGRIYLRPHITSYCYTSERVAGTPNLGMSLDLNELLIYLKVKNLPFAASAGDGIKTKKFALDVKIETGGNYFDA